MLSRFNREFARRTVEHDSFLVSLRLRRKVEARGQKVA